MEARKGFVLVLLFLEKRIIAMIPVFFRAEFIPISELKRRTRAIVLELD